MSVGVVPMMRTLFWAAVVVATHGAPTPQQDDQLPDNNHVNGAKFSSDAVAANLTAATTPRNEFLDMLKNRSRDNWLQTLKDNVLRRTGRVNMTLTRPDISLSTINISAIIPSFANSTNGDDDLVTEKIRSFYPSCELPINTDVDSWKDENYMNLYFSLDYNSEERPIYIATATLRLYRSPSENSSRNVGRSADCDTSTSSEEDKLLRVSIYWHTKSLRKKRVVKRRLSDSKVILDSAPWVELNVKPAIRAWTRGKNLGLAVLVEDQEGVVLKTDRYFKGASCTVGSSTPKPIPTIVIDAARQTNELYRIHSLLRGNSTATVPGDLSLLPTIDICTLEFPDNYSQSPMHPSAGLRVNACNLKKMYEHGQLQVEKERLERAMLPDLVGAATSRHIRHQRQHLASGMGEGEYFFDPRSKIINKRVLTPEELQNLNLDSLNITRVVDR